MQPDLFGNRTRILKDDLISVLKTGGKISTALSVFSMYAYRELREQLESIDEFRFVFASPTFLRERNDKEQREFYIPCRNKPVSREGMAQEKRITELEAQVAQLKRKYAKEVQPSKRNVAYKVYKQAKAELSALKGE